MVSQNSKVTGFSDSKSHYLVLDALRGIAALMVVAFHILETFTHGNHAEQIINHGYLAVDFFFALSGFVIGYAYDDRWDKMNLRSFLKRRLIRLHPMIILAMLFGAVTFYFQSSFFFPNIDSTPVWKLLLVLVIGFTLVPVSTSLDIRGWTEMHPLNGPAWSLFFEYVANLLYAFVLRKISNKILVILVALAAAALLHLALTGPQGDVIGGWSIEPAQFRIGLTRLLFPFLAGLLLSRVTKPRQLKNAYLYSVLLLVAMLAIPRIGGAQLWMNGLYDSLAIICVFPAIIYIGSCARVEGRLTLAISKYLGELSYPLYITHYPFIYLYMAWLAKNKEVFQNGAILNQPLLVSVSVLVYVSAVLFATACLKFYDIPVRNWLTKRYISHRKL